jgi:hypothetical protein
MEDTMMTEKIKITIDRGRAFITEVGPDGRIRRRKTALDKTQKLTVQFIQECTRAGFSLQEAFDEIGNTLVRIFALGFIPAGDDGAITGKHFPWLYKAKKVMNQYCKDFKKTFPTMDEELVWLADILPPDFSDGTRYRRNLLREV